jgi:hypothetical protein
MRRKIEPTDARSSSVRSILIATCASDAPRADP